MPWYFVKQPNGLLARFSEVVDDFTHLHLTEREALDYCRREQDMSPGEAADKVSRGLLDGPTGPGCENRGDGLDRWREAVETVRVIHGKATAAGREREGSAGPGEAPPCS